MIYTQSGGYMGIGFAIPINMARQIMEDLIYEGKVTRGWLGVMIQDLDQTTREALGLGADIRGVLIGDVFKGQPADKSGIKRGDIVVTVDNKAVETPNELRNAIAAIHPGQKVPLEVLRNGKKQTITVTLTGRDGKKATSVSNATEGASDDNATDLSEKLGIKVATITAQMYEELGLDQGIKGVVVQEVDPSSVAAQQGLQQNDVILEVNRQPVKSVKEFKTAVKSLKPGDSILLLVFREGNTFFKAFKIQK
jgi:serine protease Do